MICSRLFWCSFTLLLLIATPAWTQPAKEPLSVEQLAARIDQHLAAVWQTHGVQPAPLTDDGTFIRRVHLDLAGRIPSITRARDFLDDPAPHKRRKWVDELLDHREHNPLYVRHFANVWRAWLLDGTSTEQQPYFGVSIEAWLVKQLQENTSYDALVRELLAGSSGRQDRASPSVFYAAHGYKTEEVAASVSRLFLGVKLECAQCHNHPFAKWSKQQFWEFAAFFSDLRQAAPNQDPEVKPKPPTPGEIAIPGTDRTVKARFLGGAEAPRKPGVPARAALAEWMTAADNPFFARAVVNRLWTYFFGTGLAEPAEEVDEAAVPEHAALLDDLARQLVLHQYDLKYLIRAIVASQAYQRSSTQTHASQEQPRLFARMALRGLTGEQLFDSLAEATGYQVGYQDLSDARRRFFDSGGAATPRAEFVAKFTSFEKPTERTTTILQALFLMNGKFMTDATALDRNKVLTTIAESKSNTQRKIDELFLVTLGRLPRSEDRTRLMAYVEKGGVSDESHKAFADVYWALLNSAEFMLNH